MKEIIIPSREKLFTVVDDELYEKINSLRWWLHSKGYAVCLINGKRWYMHRYVMHLLNIDIPLGLEIDHINGFKLDNRKENLRICTRSSNSMNTGSRKNNKSSKYKGVSYWCHGRKKPWRAKLNNKYLGYYYTEVEAASAYNKYAKEKYGDYAYLNVIF
jgi:hypothetical protein